MKHKRFLDTNKPAESQILVILLAILYGIFVISGFVKCTYFWGINFLYYLPLWIKLVFSGVGGLVFLPYVNTLFYKLYRLIATHFGNIQQHTQLFIYRLPYLILLSAGFAGLFYLFHIVSLYHAPMGAIQFMERNIPIADYYKEWVLVEDKYTLLLYWAAFRYVFHTLLHLSNYWSLAVPSIIFGVLFVIFLDFFLRKLDLQPVQQFFVFIMIFTQSITYYYFGFANYYGPVPFVIFLYLFSVVTHFKNNTSLLLPCIMGLAAIFTHLGALFIFPSLMFLIIHKYSTTFPWLYDLFTFKSFKKSVFVFLAILILSYIALNTLSLTGINLQEYTVPPLKLKRLYGWPLLSFGYFIHLFNMVMLISPLGMLIFIVSLKYFRNLSIWGDFKYSFLWFAVGGILYIVLLHPITIFAWDAWAWASVGYTFLGAMLFLHSSKQLKQYVYLTTLIITHALMYFGAWLVLNNNIYASVLNYLDTAETFDPQLTWCLQIMNENHRNPDVTKGLLQVLEGRVRIPQDYLSLSQNYETLNEPDKANIMSIKFQDMLADAIEKKPNNGYNYYQFLSYLVDSVRTNPENREFIENLYRKTIELEPNNITYHLSYGLYLWNFREYQKVFSIYQKVDSLYQIQNFSKFRTVMPYPELKIDLTRIGFKLNKFKESIKYFNEALAAGATIKNKYYQEAFLNCLVAYAVVGDIINAEKMLSTAHQQGFALDLNKDSVIQIAESLMK